MIGGRRRGWIAAAQVAVGLGILAVVLWRLEWGRVVGVVADASWPWIAAAAAAQAVGKVVWAYRWREILHAFDVRRGLGELTVLVLVGLFFSSFLPGGIGGDVVRGYYASDDRDGLVTSYSVVLLERILGVGGLAAVGLAAGATLVLGGGAGYPAPLLTALTGGAAALLLAAALPFAWRGWQPILDLTSAFGERTERVLRGLADGRDLFRRDRVRPGRVLGSTLVMQVVKVLFAYCCARAVGLELSLLVLSLVVPAALIVAMAPITLNGLGLREGSLVGLLAAGGTEPAMAGGFVLLSLGVGMAFAAVGGLLYAGNRWLPVDLPVPRGRSASARGGGPR